VDAYERSLKVFRGSRMGAEDYLNAIKGLGVNDEVLLNLKPSNYTGYAESIARDVAGSCRALLNEVEGVCRREEEFMTQVLGID